MGANLYCSGHPRAFHQLSYMVERTADSNSGAAEAREAAEAERGGRHDAGRSGQQWGVLGSKY